MWSNRLLLKKETTQAEVLLLASDENWITAQIQPRTNNQPYRITFLTQDGQTAIDYVDDFIIRQHFLIVDGDDQKRITEILHRRLRVYEPEEILGLARAAEKDAEFRFALGLMILIAGEEFDLNLFHEIERICNHPDDTVRRFCANVLRFLPTSYFSQLPFVALANKMKSDSDEEVRQNAETIPTASMTEKINN